jgi:hypothetical protein
MFPETSDLVKYLSRRELFRYMGSGLLAAPMASLVRGQSLTAAENPPFVLMIYIPAGIEGDAWFPAQADLSGPFPFVSQPLEELRDELIFFKCFDTVGPSNHSGGVKQVFAGGGADRTALNSLDHILGDLDPVSPFKRVAMGLGSTRPSDGNHVSWKNDEGIKVNDDPQLTFETLFGSQRGDQAAMKRRERLLGQKRVLDHVKDDFNRLKTSLGRDEATIFEAHVTALDELNQEINRLLDSAQASCRNLGTIEDDMGRLNTEHSWWPLWYHKNENIPIIATLNRRMMYEALACGLTRVGVLQFGASNTLMPLNVEDRPRYSEQHHSLSHSGGEAFRLAQQSIVTEAVRLIKSLKETPTADGSSFLDQGLVYMASCLGDQPNMHNGANIPCFIAGRAQGRLRPGQLITGSATPYNHILVTLTHAAGKPQPFVGHRSYTEPVRAALQV